MNRIRKMVALAVYSVVLVAVPLVYNAGITAPPQSAYHLVCSGTICGNCC